MIRFVAFTWGLAGVWAWLLFTDSGRGAGILGYVVVLGATLADLRRTFESVVEERIAAGDDAISLLPGEKLVSQGQLADEVHPDDAGHRAVANAIVPLLSRASSQPPR